MTFYVKDPATDKAVRACKLKGKTLTETIREAVELSLLSKPGKKSSRFLNASNQYRTGLPLGAKPGWKRTRRLFDELMWAKYLSTLQRSGHVDPAKKMPKSLPVNWSRLNRP